MASDPCDLLDVGCVLEGDEVDTVDDAVGTVLETIEPITDATDPVVRPILDVVEDIAGGEVIDPPTVGTGGDHTAGPGASGDDPRGAEETPGRRAPDRITSTAPAVSIREGGTGPGIEISSRSGSGSERPEEVSGGPGGIIGSAVRGLLLVIVLFAIVLAFVTLQDRLDRNDPKLALAPVDPDVVRFE